MTRLGYQIPNFTYPGEAGSDIFGNVATRIFHLENCWCAGN